jgi:sensor histidine kinase regulating citrate/malate metabolism
MIAADRVKAMRLRTKTTLLSAVIVVTMLISALVFTSAAIANIERVDDETLAEIQARDLAQHISDGRSGDTDALANAANLIKGSRPGILTVRIWELSQGDFRERASAAGSASVSPIPEETKAVLRGGRGPNVLSVTPPDSNHSLYRVFATTFANGQPSGAVEIVQRFDSIGTVVVRYLKSVVWMSLVAIALIVIGTYFLLRQLQLTTQLETEQGVLRERVRDATIELERSHE